MFHISVFVLVVSLSLSGSMVLGPAFPRPSTTDFVVFRPLPYDPVPPDAGADADVRGGNRESALREAQPKVFLFIWLWLKIKLEG